MIRGTQPEQAEVLLCNLPFGLLASPSLALGLLQSCLLRHDLRSRQANLQLRFARELGAGRYELVARRWEAAEWVFAHALFPGRDLDPDGFIQQILRRPSRENWTLSAAQSEGEAARLVEESAGAAIEARRHVPAFIDECVDIVARRAPRVVGFSCTFQQRIASLALAAAIKRQWPETFIVFGGVECQGVRGRELFRRFSSIDALVSGPGERVFPELVRRVLTGQPVGEVPGVLARGARGDDGPETRLGLAAAPAGLDELPYPVFDDYFSELAETGVDVGQPQYLSLETSRGCAWAARPERHCVFCGLNAQSPAPQAKSSARMVEEIRHFAGRYPGLMISMTDSSIPEEYFATALPALARAASGATIQYETRAALSRVELEALVGAGITQIQAGIESLSTPVLRLMHKGTTMLGNVRLLKWARELGVTVLWNVLAGIPDEPESAYGEMVALIPKLMHLAPPQSFRYASIVRDSPLFERARTQGAPALAPPPAYEYVFPFDAAARFALAAQFPRDTAELERLMGHTVGLAAAIHAWQRAHANSDLVVVYEGDSALVADRRPHASQRVVMLQGLAGWLHAACADGNGLGSLRRGATQARLAEATSLEVDETLAWLEERDLIIREGTRFLSLALPILSGRVRPPDTHEHRTVRCGDHGK